MLILSLWIVYFSNSIFSNWNMLAETCFPCSRFEPDMLAFSGCYYGGGDKERKELGKIRKRWKTLHVSH